MQPKAHPNINCSVISVTNTATTLFSLIETAGSVSDIKATFGDYINGLDITVGDSIRITWDGTTPTALLGELLTAGRYSFRNRDLSKMRLIRVGGSNVSCSVVLGSCDEDETESYSSAGGSSASGGATEAKQDDQITQETAINTVLGLKNDSVATTDTGTFSIVALVKRGLQTLSSIYTAMTTTKSSVAVSFNSTGDNTIQAVAGGTTARIYRVDIVADAATNITLKLGATSLTGAIPLVANGGISFSSELSALWVGGDGDDIIINQSGTANVRGFISYYVA